MNNFVKNENEHVDYQTAHAVQAVAGYVSPASEMLCCSVTIESTNVAQQLVSESTPCKAVWIGAPVTLSTGAAANTHGVLVGNADTQAFPIMPSNYEGKTFPIDDASKLWVLGVDGESVMCIVYR